jgi:hypothetical protein
MRLGRGLDKEAPLRRGLQGERREQIQLWCSNGYRESTIFYAVLRQRRTPSTAGAIPCCPEYEDGMRSSHLNYIGESEKVEARKFRFLGCI